MGLGRVGRSIRARLTLGFFVITVAAIGGIYLYVVPRLESRLTDQHLDALSADGIRYGPVLKATVGSSLAAGGVARRIGRVAAATNARVALLRVGRAGSEPQPQVVT